VPTLDQIEGVPWGEPPDGATRLIRRAHELRRTPIEDFSFEDLRLMIGQNIGLESLVPRALAIVAKDPFAAGDLYEGDLLTSLFAVPNTYWTEHQDLWWQLREVAERLISLRSVIDRADAFVHTT
jgi:hypothetical protein